MPKLGVGENGGNGSGEFHGMGNHLVNNSNVMANLQQQQQGTTYIHNPTLTSSYQLFL